MDSNVAITIKYIEEYAKEWREMTEDNDHSSVRVRIAAAFQLRFFMSAFSKIEKHVDRWGYITPEIANERYYLTQGMIEMIRAKYGDEIADKVYDSL